MRKAESRRRSRRSRGVVVAVVGGLWCSTSVLAPRGLRRPRLRARTRGCLALAARALIRRRCCAVRGSGLPGRPAQSLGEPPQRSDATEHPGAARGVPLVDGAHELGRGHRRWRARRIVRRVVSAFATLCVNLVVGDSLGVHSGKVRAGLRRVYEPAEQVRVQRALDGSSIALNEGSTTRRTPATMWHRAPR